MPEAPSTSIKPASLFAVARKDNFFTASRRNVSQLLTIGDKWASHLSRSFPHRFSQHPVFLKAKNPLSQLY